MPTKLGNAGHGQENYDPNTGRYVSNKDNIGSNADLFPNISFASIMDFAKQKQEQKEAEQKEKIANFKFENLKQAELIGDEILGRENIVRFDNKTDIEVANQMVRALSDINKDFSIALRGTVRYGTSYGGYEQAFESIQKPVADFISDFFGSENAPLIKVLQERGKSPEEIKSVIKSFNIISDSIINIQMGKHTFGSNFHFMAHNETEQEFIKSITTTYLNKGKAQNVNDFAFINENDNPELTKLKKQVGFHKAHSDKGYAYDSASHELGHAIYKFLIPYMGWTQKGIIEDLTVTGKNIKHVKKYSDDHQWVMQHVPEPAKTDESNIVQAFRNGEVSRYALENSQEAVAEAFSDYYGNGEKCSNYNKKIVSFLMEVYKTKVLPKWQKMKKQ